MATPQETLARLRAQLEAQQPGPGGAEGPGIAASITGPAALGVGRVAEAPSSLFGETLGLNALADIITSGGSRLAGLFTGEEGKSVEEVRKAREAFQAAEEEKFRQRHTVAPGQTTGEKVAQFVGGAAPDVALGVASLPLFTAGQAAAAGRGAGPLASLFAGEVAQSAALAPVEFATRDAKEAAAITAIAPVAGTVLGRAAGALGKAVFGGTAEEAAENAVARASVMDRLRAGGSDEALRQMGRQNFSEAAEVTRQVVRRGDISKPAAERLVADVERQLAQLAPSQMKIVAETMRTLPEEAAGKFARLVAAGPPKDRTALEWLRTVRASSMLSGFGTHVRNNVANALNVVTKPARTLAAAGVDPFLAAPAGVKAGVKSRSLKEGVKAFRENRQRFAAEAFGEIYGFSKALPAALKQAGEEARAVREGVSATGADKTFSQQFAQEPVAAVVEAPLRMLNVADRFWFDATFTGEMYRQAVRQAEKEGVSSGKLAKRIGEILGDQEKTAQRIAELRTRATRARAVADGGADAEGKKSALNLARQLEAQAKELEKSSFISDAAFMADRTIFTAREGEQLDQAMDTLDKWAARNPIINAVLPFRRTPANVARETLRSSPAGLATGAHRAYRAVNPAEEGVEALPFAGAAQGRLADDLGQAVMGTGMLYFILDQASSGNIRINPFKERARAERVTEEAAGIVPDSVIIGGKWSIPVSRLEPIGAMILAAGKVAELQAQDAPPDSYAELAQEFEEFATILATQSARESFVDPLVGFFEAAYGDDRTLNRWAQQLGGSFVPRAISQFKPGTTERITDEDVAETGASGFIGNFLAGAKRQVPGAAELDLGLFGEERKTQAPISSLVIGRSGEVGRDPLAQEMLRVDALHLPPTGLSKDFTKKLEARGIGYSGAEDRQLRMAKGRAQRLVVERIVNSPLYQRLPQDARGDALRKKLIDDAFRKASTEINERAKALKLAKMPLTPQNLLGRR